MLRRLLVLGAMTTAVLFTGAPAFAAPPVTETIHEKVVETFVDQVPVTCDEGGPKYTITINANTVGHITTFDDGRVHSTFTQTGTFVAVPKGDPSLPSCTGKFTIRAGFNDNGKTVNGTCTFNIHGTGSDGTTFSKHFGNRFNVRPDGTVNEFFRCN